MKKYIIEVNKGEEFISGEVSQKSYERFKYFVDNYTFERDLNGGKDTKLGLLLPKDERICRFCQKGYPEVKFETKAHTIPQQWGRCKPINLFECDDCNRQFSKWETDFGDYFLINRALLGSKKKKGYPKYKTNSSTQIESMSPDKLDLSESEREKVIKKIGKDKFVVLIRQGNIEEVKREGNMISFNLLRKPFRPINVYKVFLKIGLSLIPETDLPKFTFLLTLLNSDREILKEKEDSFSGFSIIHSQFSTFKSIFEFPIVSLYKRNIQSSNFIERVMVIFFENSFYQIPLFSNEDFNKLKIGETKMKRAQISPYLNPAISINAMNSKIFHEDMENIQEEELKIFCSRLIKDSRVEFTIKENKE